jgi:hypothetical protein
MFTLSYLPYSSVALFNIYIIFIPIMKSKKANSIIEMFEHNEIGPNWVIKLSVFLSSIKSLKIVDNLSMKKRICYSPVVVGTLTENI